ncbi:universal stress protein [Gracilibacillus sp. YIM 98692]|uniref:universal stress protein n=1 Tax=Gracilibacillus sp. YIM 98692 TaxID=2663532 RepID=UPI0013D79BBB|nr:universal stress protein [Gracilibacillus sp. YIM 98692]
MHRKILVAYDGSNLSKKALEEAKVQAVGISDVEIHIISVVSQAGPRTNSAVARSIQEDVANEMRPQLEEIKSSFTDVERVFTDILIDSKQNNASVKICKYAKEKDIDLIITGSRGLGSIKKFLLGSVSNGIVQNAECRVLIVK